jgi:hypothetical protein
MEEVIVTGCGDCPFFQWDAEEGAYCHHPQNGENKKWVDFDQNHSNAPANCPLREIDVIVKLTPTLKRYAHL